MDLYTIRLFLDAARTLNFTKVAGNYYTTQPAVSRRMNDLEKELGCRLFTRENHGVALTKEAKLILPFFQKAVASIDSGLESLNTLSNYKQDTISIAAMIPMSSSFLPKQIYNYMSNHDNVDIKITRMFSRQIRESIANGGIYDIYISVENDLALNDTWEKKILHRSTIGLVVRNTIDLHTTEEIIDYMHNNHVFMLSLGDAPTVTGNARRLLTLYEVKPSLWVQTALIESVLTNVSAGLGYTLLPQNDTLFKGYGLKFIPLEKNYTYTIEIAYRHKASPYVHDFVSKLLENSSL